MRRIITTAVAVALMGGAALAGPAATADTRTDLPTAVGSAAAGSSYDLLEAGPGQGWTARGHRSASQSLATARRVLGGDAQPRDPSVTMALRDLWRKKSDLRGNDRRLATTLLARPSDGTADPQGFGYTAPEALPVCNTRICVHYVGLGNDAPPTPEWPAQNLAVLDSVWTTIVDQLGYRAPLTDGTRGGNALFDVYLKDLGSGLYGYCVPEKRVKNRTASGYCVLDDDFSVEQFPDATPDQNLLVTAGHEFFHAVQFAYDYAEDPWMAESTSTWMEERIATQVNDNRQYLPESQLYAPYVPLDAFSNSRSFQYGNWVFWEYLSTKYGTDIVQKAWDQAGSLKKDGGKYSIGALQKILKRKGGLTKVYASFVAGNLTPAVNYPEGAEYPYPQLRNGKRLSKGKRAKRFATSVNHLASASYLYVPGRGLSGRTWKLSVAVNGPVRRTSPAAVVVVHLLDGRRQVRRVKLNHRGDGRTRVSFDGRKVAAVSVSLINASTRYSCDRGTLLACGGKPLDDKLRFSVTGRVTK